CAFSDVSLRLVLLHGHDDHRALPSFPTRRSSDLQDRNDWCARVCSRVDGRQRGRGHSRAWGLLSRAPSAGVAAPTLPAINTTARSEEHTSELQSQSNLVCRLLLEKKNKNTKQPSI